MSEARKPRGLRRFARVGMLAAWTMFCPNTALFPCGEVAAAVFGGHADNGSQSASAAPLLHHTGATHSESLGHSPDSPCGDALISRLPLVGAYEGLTPDRFPLEWFAVAAPVATGITAVNRPAILALAQAAPPPSPRLYLRTQRLLI